MTCHIKRVINLAELLNYERFVPGYNNDDHFSMPKSVNLRVVAGLLIPKAIYLGQDF